MEGATRLDFLATVELGYRDVVPGMLVASLLNNRITGQCHRRSSFGRKYGALPFFSPPDNGQHVRAIRCCGSRLVELGSWGSLSRFDGQQVNYKTVPALTLDGLPI